MATKYPATRFTFLVDMLRPLQQPNNVRFQTGHLKDLHDDTFDLIHFQRPLAMRELDDVIALSKPGACVQTVQFQIKVCTFNSSLYDHVMNNHVRTCIGAKWRIDPLTSFYASYP